MTGSEAMNRRSLIAALGAGTVVWLAGCDAAPRPPVAGEGAATPPEPAARGASIHVYRDPECGCCEAWAAIARDAGYAVTVESRTDMPAIKARHGVPDELHSCHTAIADGYAIEGHVPLASVARLLAERPADIRGIAVPGMPRGSPGMEMPDGSVDPYQVMAFGAAGRISVFGA
jgi:hypothetical protein